MGKFLKIAVGGVAVAAIAIGVGVGVGVRNKNQEKNSTAAASTSEEREAACRRLLVVPGVEDSFTYEAPSVRRKMLARSLGVEGNEVGMMPAKPSSNNYDDGAWGSPAYGPTSVAKAKSSTPKGSTSTYGSTSKGSSSKQKGSTQLPVS